MQLLSDYRLISDSGDAWGSSMEAFFSVADELYFRDGETPSEWRYRPGTMSGDPRQPDSVWFEILENESNDTLLHFGRFLHRYTGMLKAAGKDY